MIVVCTSMTAWYIVRTKSKFSKLMYVLFLFSMIVPFQMVMYTMTFVVNKINFDNLPGIVFVYLGFGAGLSVFMLSGFVKSIPLEIEEAAIIDGCNPLQTFFLVVFPILKPTAITVAILNAMWIWNDYLLRCNGLRRIYGNACACGYSDYRVLYFRPEIYYQGRCCRCR